MAEESRIQNSKLNILFGFANSFITTILGFVTRSVFIYTLGVNYLGLNGLYTNILSLLSLAELGIGSAITFSLYKPIAEHDNKKIKALMQLYKSAYQKIGIIILVVGLSLVPFLKYLVNFQQNVDINYQLIYVLFLADSVISYLFFAYRSVIVYANQKGYVLTKYETTFSIIRSVVQFLVLIIFKNYYMYLIIPIMISILKNLLISIKAGKMFPVINEKGKEELDKEEKDSIFKNIYSLALFKISSVVYTSTDNIIISSFLGTAIVGFYSNYSMLTQMVSSYINIIFQSLYASVGNLNATESKEYKYTIFERLQLLNIWIYGIVVVCMNQFFNPFIKLWLGSDYCFSQKTVLIISIMFLLPGLNNVINIYKDSCGLFWETRYRALATAIVNLVVSIVLVKKIGLEGVFIGTIVAYLTTIYMVDPRVVFQKIFKKSIISYYISLIKTIVIYSITAVLVRYICSLISVTGWIGLILQGIAAVILINIFFIIIFGRLDEFKYYKNLLLRGLKR